MFFLDSLDLKRDPIIEELVESDDPDILCILGIPTLKKKIPQPQRMDLMSVEEQTSTYLLGPRPTWKDIAASIKDNPTFLIPPWVPPRHLLEKYGDMGVADKAAKIAGEVFLQFTWQIWLKLGHDWRTNRLSDVHPTTIEDALRQWLVDECLKITTTAVF